MLMFLADSQQSVQLGDGTLQDVVTPGPPVRGVIA